MANFYFNFAFFKRFFKELKIIFPKWSSVSSLLFFSLLCIVLLEQFVVYHVGLLPSSYYMILGEKNKSEFWKQTGIAVAYIVSISFILASKKYASSIFYITSREMLTKHMHGSYFSGICYYKLNVLDDTIDNVDQRIAQDVDKMCNIFGQIIPDLLVSPFTIAYYTYQTWISAGYIGPVCVYVFFVISTTINKFLMSPIVALVYRQEKLEGDFRFKHVQLRSNSESAAFYRCGPTEERKMNEKFDSLLTVQRRLTRKQFFLGFSVNMADYLGSILSYIILAIPIFAGVYDHLDATELSSLISKCSFFTMYLIFCFTRLIDMAPQVADMAGCSHRIGQLIERMKQLAKDDDVDDVSENDSVQNLRNTQTVAYILRDVTIAPPKNTSDHLLVKELNMEVVAGRNILVTGDSGIGKSSLVRALDGLWPLVSGTIRRELPRGQNGVFYLPQKPYLTTGTLRHQITFPDICSGHHDDRSILRLLNLAGLDGLIERTGGLDFPIDWNWYNVLSPGEMQRIAFVRLFYHQPLFAVLDEATSQITIDVERTLYNHCKSLGITLVSVGHRSSLVVFHQMELQLSSHGEWRLLPIEEQFELSSDGATHF